MYSKLGRAVAAAGLATLLAPSVAFASWWDGGYQPATREQPPRKQPPPAEQPGPAQPAPGPGSAPGPAPGPGALPSIYGCENSTLPGTRPVLHKETTPPSGTRVAPGQEIVVEITWRVTDWLAPELHKALDCVYINNRYAPALSGGERPTPNDGHFAYRYVVPADVAPGSTICDQGFVSGPNREEEYGREVSNVVCFPVGQPPPPPVETTTTTTTSSYERPPQALPERISRQAPAPTPPAPAVLPRPNVLPRTGGDPNPGRLAAGALALATLTGRGLRRRGARRPRRS